MIRFVSDINFIHRGPWYFDFMVTELKTDLQRIAWCEVVPVDLFLNDSDANINNYWGYGF